MEDTVIPFPTLKESQVLREDIGKLEKDISSNLDKLQEINEEIVRLTISYEEMLYRLCEITGVELPNNLDFEGEPEE